MAIDWREIPRDARAYLIPQGFVSAARADERARILAGGSLAFTQLRLIISDGEARLIDRAVNASECDGMIREAPDPFGERLSSLLTNITSSREALSLPRGDTVSLSKPVVMGVVNVTPDSFSDGGDFAETDAAIAQAERLIAEGADIIDIGGESTRPGAKTVWEGDERERVLPVISALKGGKPVSIDSRRASIQEAAIEAGAQIINDVSALRHDDGSLPLAARTKVPVILMHAKGDPRTMQEDPQYGDVILEVFDFLDDRVRACEEAGIPRGQLVVDPGIGFGKSVRHNLALIENIAILHGLGSAVMIGTSRKRFIGALAGEEEAKARVPGTLASTLHALDRGVQMVRVHDVAPLVQALAVRQGLNDVSFLAP